MHTQRPEEIKIYNPSNYLDALYTYKVMLTLDALNIAEDQYDYFTFALAQYQW